MQEMIRITCKMPDGKILEREVLRGSSFDRLSQEMAGLVDGDIILAKWNGKLKELKRKIRREGCLEWVTTSQTDGKRTYRRSMVLLLQEAVRRLYGDYAGLTVRYSLGSGYYCEIERRTEDFPCKNPESPEDSGTSVKFRPEREDLKRLALCMHTIAEQDLPIEKKTVKTSFAEKWFKRHGLPQKARVMHYRRSSTVNVYRLGGSTEYYYGYLACRTGILKYFDLVPYRDSFILQFPGEDGRQLKKFITSDKLFMTLKASREWSRMLNVGNVGALNDAFTQGRGQEIVLLQEALMEDRIGDLAGEIAAGKEIRFIMIAGPSSSGKTSFANRLSLQLMANGMRPYAISLDDYFKNREDCPLNEDGSYNFECPEALDLDLFNDDMERLLHGESVMLPSFNFRTGKREYRGTQKQLQDGDVLVIEGIHGLNPLTSAKLPDKSKFKIYISALTQLNLDEHNLLSTTDCRLLRRMVRDARTRNTTAEETIAMWPSVRAGEEKYIFPYQEGADVMFNSALVYELAVLKVYAEPLLFQIQEGSEQYNEAARLLKILNYFLPYPVEGICNNSLIREFVGGSCFRV